ncbi:MAG TPA: carbonic anhydrase [bacterium]|nr:carbonic anhydrase [bacterium]
MENIAADDALRRLQDGNARFASNVRSLETLASALGRGSLLDDQRPFAVVVSCSDSRVPAEMVFDQGVGALFIVRVAGNIIAPSQIGSVEFAIDRFNTKLVVVMGHTRCGAIDAAIDAAAGNAPLTRGLKSIVDRVLPAVEPLLSAGVTARETLRREAVRANAKIAADHLRHGSVLVEEALSHGLRVEPAVYDLETGKVEFLRL